MNYLIKSMTSSLLCEYSSSISASKKWMSTSVILNNIEIMKLIGKREIVGFGPNGKPMYEDSVMFPYPAIRFKEITPSLKAIKEKERGDWKALTQTEKKCLYRMSFCQTLAEVNANTGEIKSIIGMALIACNVAVLLYLFVKYLTWEDLPETFSQERQEAQLRRILDLRMNPITGISSKWDYDRDTWVWDTSSKK